MRKIKIISLLSFIMVNANSFCQDILVFKNGNEEKVKVTEVFPTQVKYIKADNLTGPIYIIYKTDLFMIKYENGTKEVFPSEPNKEAISKNTDVPEQKAKVEIPKEEKPKDDEPKVDRFAMEGLEQGLLTLVRAHFQMVYMHKVRFL